MKHINEDKRRQWKKASQRLLATAVAATMPFTMAVVACADETPNGVNVASLATASASYTTSWNKVAAVNDGELSNDAAGIWGTYGHASASETLTYAFSNVEQTISAMRVHLWTDGTGVFLPKSLNVTTGDGTPVSNLKVSEIADNDYVTLTFDPVTASKFNLVLDKQQTNTTGVAVNEWQIFANPTAATLRQLANSAQATADSDKKTVGGLKVRLYQDGSGVLLPKSFSVTTGDAEIYGSGDIPVSNLQVSQITDSDWVTLTFDPVTARTFNLVFNKQGNDTNGVAASEIRILDQNGHDITSSVRSSYVSDVSYWNSADVLRDGKEAGTAEDGTVDQSTLWGTSGYKSASETVTYSFAKYTIPTTDALDSALATADNAIASGDANAIRDAYASLLSAQSGLVNRGHVKWYWTSGYSDRSLTVADSVNYVTNLWSQRTSVTSAKGVSIRYAPSGNCTAEGGPSSDYGDGGIKFCTQLTRRTALHEMSHVMGMYVGGWQWKNVLCTGGKWYGEKANAAAGQTLSCDNGHGSVWPWGMNYENEYVGNSNEYTASQRYAKGKKQVDIQFALRQDTMNPKPIITSSAKLATAAQWADYSKSLSTAPGFIVGSGRSTVTKFEIVNGRLPEGMSLSADGKISGKPTEAGSFSFEIRVTNKAGKASNKVMSLTVNAAENPEVPQNLAYYVDAGVRGTAASAQYTKIADAYAQDGKSLLNDKPDQQSDGTWGVSTSAKVRKTSDTGKDATALMATGKSLGYRFTLEPGAYTLQAGFNGFGKNGTMSQKVTWSGGNAGTQASVSIADGKTATGTVTFTLTERKTATYTATRTAGANPNLTWILVQRR